MCPESKPLKYSTYLSQAEVHKKEHVNMPLRNIETLCDES